MAFWLTTLESRKNLRPSAALNLVAPGGSVATGSRSFAHAVQAAVRSVEECTLHPVAPPDAGLAFQPKTLLALLTYCYARQIYGSADIENLLRRDAHLRQLWGSEFPGACVIHNFRRDNRHAIRFCLLAVLRFLAEQKIAEGFVTKVNKAHLAEEASRRITMATKLHQSSGQVFQPKILLAVLSYCYARQIYGSAAADIQNVLIAKSNAQAH